MRRRHLAVWVATCVGAGIGRWAVAQTAPPVAPPASSPPASSPGAATTAGTQAAAQPFTAVQLDQLLAPIALYPDALLAQTLMAATYPLEVVEAARWSQDNPTLKGDAALAAVKDKGWDVSVTSLAAFPQVLAMMNSKLDWVQKVGDAMIAQQSDVAASIQRLRAQAQSAGNLKSTPQQTVTTQAASAGAPADTPAAIVIQPTNPDTVYVPSYNPSWAYGTWPYPNDPPIYFPPPPGYGYGYGGPGWSGLSFGLGFAVGGAFFGGWSWGGGWGGGWGWRGWGGWGTWGRDSGPAGHVGPGLQSSSAPWALRTSVAVGASVLMWLIGLWFVITLQTSGPDGIAERVLTSAQTVWPLFVVTSCLIHPHIERQPVRVRHW